MTNEEEKNPEPNDKNHTFDFSRVQAEETERIWQTTTEENATGLAFSGGGIRSASFGMGLMQALVAEDKLTEMDYLSSVSGGGYLSSSLTWYLSQRTPVGKAPYGTSSDDFPFGKKDIGAKDGGKSDDNAILDYIRQHGNYLIPGHGLNALSFVATVLRVMVGSFLIYFSLLVAALFVLVAAINAVTGETIPLYFFDYPLNFASIFFALAVIATLLLVLTSLRYSLATHSGVAEYSTDIGVQRRIGKYFLVILAMLVLASLPVIQNNASVLVALLTGSEPDSDFVISGSVSISASVLGAIFSFLLHRKQVISETGVSSWQIIIAAILVLFGLLLGAYVVAGQLIHLLREAWWIWTWAGWAAFVIAILYIGTHCNVNIFGLNRMYRNRLMETFMQSPENVMSGKWHEATEANQAKVATMCTEPNQRPYHLINCNVVLVDSDNAKYRGRKGDSFTVSPLYCGSDATGWRKTDDYLKGKWRSGITLPTAMAISGAAANPNAGVAGRGPTTDQFLSLLMSILNLRLGFWAANPKIDSESSPPNYIDPGILFRDLDEDAKTLELTDGGHFENLAIYELLRRQVKLIVVSDAGQDQKYQFADLGNAVEKARVDFGIKIVFEEKYPIEEIMPGSDDKQSDATKDDYLLSKRGFAVAKIYYPKREGMPKEVGYLVYVKPALIDGIGADLIAYKRDNATFPHQTTADQFFDEVQFEAYRELGFIEGKDLLKQLKESGSEVSGNTTILSEISRLL